MRITFGIGTRLWVLETVLTKARIKPHGAQEEDPEEVPGVDPTGTLACHAELSPQAVGLTSRSFGFHGSEGA